jgi:hypothetical protein
LKIQNIKVYSYDLYIVEFAEGIKNYHSCMSAAIIAVNATPIFFASQLDLLMPLKTARTQIVNIEP